MVKAPVQVEVADNGGDHGDGASEQVGLQDARRPPRTRLSIRNTAVVVAKTIV
jgi:hypothetical protein